MARLSLQQKRRAAAAAAAAAAQIILSVADAPLLDEAQHVKVIDALHAYEKLRKLLARVRVHCQC
jgi:ABC-type lipoprotein export system ATPase subunit